MDKRGWKQNSRNIKPATFCQIQPIALVLNEANYLGGMSMTFALELIQICCGSSACVNALWKAEEQKHSTSMHMKAGVVRHRISSLFSLHTIIRQTSKHLKHRLAGGLLTAWLNLRLGRERHNTEDSKSQTVSEVSWHFSVMSASSQSRFIPCCRLSGLLYMHGALALKVEITTSFCICALISTKLVPQAKYK